MRRLDFYFDLISPYSYLAWTQLPDLVKKFNLDLHAQPILFAALLKHHGQKGPAEIPAKRIFTIHDMLRWADLYKVALVGPPTHPFNPLLPLRAIMSVQENSRRNDLAGALLNAAWGEGLDVTQPEIIEKVAASVGLPGSELLKKTADSDVKERLKENTSKAIEKGVFGVPTFIVEDQFFWGNDRLPLLRDYLAGKSSIPEKRVQEILSRPSTADRR